MARRNLPAMGIILAVVMMAIPPAQTAKAGEPTGTPQAGVACRSTDTKLTTQPYSRVKNSRGVTICTDPNTLGTVAYTDGPVIQIKPNSELYLVPVVPGGPPDIALYQGAIHFSGSSQGRRPDIYVRTIGAAIVARGTEIEASHDESAHTSQVLVFSGTADLSDAQRKTTITLQAGQSGSLIDGSEPVAATFDPDQADKWWARVTAKTATTSSPPWIAAAAAVLLGLLFIAAIYWILRRRRTTEPAPQETAPKRR